VGVPTLRAAVATAQTFNSATTSCAVTKPTGTVSGDVWVVELFNGSLTPTCTTPTGWTLIDGPTDLTDVRGYAFYRLCDGTEGATQAFVMSGTGGTKAFASVSYQGTFGASPIHAHTPSTTNGTGITPAVTTTLSSLIVAGVGLASGVTVTAPGSPYTSRVTITSGPTISLGDDPHNDTGSLSEAYTKSGGAANWVAFIFALVTADPLPITHQRILNQAVQRAAVM
jgi:hypothetical protein